MKAPLPFGTRLSDERYQRSVAALYNGLPEPPSPEQETAVRRKSLNLAIDHRLGVDFPASRRDALWEVQQRIARNHLRVACGLVFTGLVRLLTPTNWLTRKGLGAAGGYVHRQFARVLSPDELAHFLGDDDEPSNEPPSSPARLPPSRPRR
ncbi:hypothetical protein DFR29_11543 [Tahibacter aquaticus]|uniref:Uncharacterized protein n=1 Tax=Tahibacter aquaticus TaxID=520092 RepID=A0A4R6YPK0_9GAMM|nr:hypothetical protein [Tahibacter aquaticus]TDR39655.1 hypothetical protein DFR29_11543 [Tahibacter aquaticus]